MTSYDALGQFAFWTVGTIAGFYLGFSAFLLATHRLIGRCVLDVCSEASWPVGLGLAAMSGVTLMLWSETLAWAVAVVAPPVIAVVAG